MAESLLSGFLLRPNPENAVAEVARVLRRLAAVCWILLHFCVFSRLLSRFHLILCQLSAQEHVWEILRKAWWSICLEYLHASGPSGGVRHSDRPGRNVRSVSTSNDAHVRMGTNRNPYRFWTEEELQSSDSKKFWRRGRAEVSKEDNVLQTSRKPRHNGFT